ncbi:MAG: hypothetical protein V5A44_06495 [Haloarculaceae archaeon]
MVVDRTTDGDRIAQLLASELSGRDGGALARLSVVDADRDATPSPDGPPAYGVAVDDRQVADVRIYPDGADVCLDGGSARLAVQRVVDAVRGPGLSVETPDDGTVVLQVEYGAAVKRAVDALVAGVER